MTAHDPWTPPRAVVVDAAEEMDGRKPATIWLLQAFILLVLAASIYLVCDSLVKDRPWQSIPIPLFMMLVSVCTLVMAGRRRLIGGWLGFFFVAGTLVVSIIGLYLADQQGSGIVRSPRNYVTLAIILLPQVALLLALPMSRRVRHFYRAKPDA